MVIAFCVVLENLYDYIAKTKYSLNDKNNTKYKIISKCEF